MPTKFEPAFKITPEISQLLLKIEAAKERSNHLPLNPQILSSLRETAKLYTTHYSTMIEGNRLSPEEVKQVITLNGHFPGRERDEHEVRGYYSALEKMEQHVAKGLPVSEKIIQTLHGLVMNKKKPTPYRDGQNVIKDGSSGNIVYLPPEAKDVPGMMGGLVEWIRSQTNLPTPIIAAIAHYQFATIHPYYDGNGRVSRLLTALIMHLSGYDLKGLFSLEEYYAKNLMGYYQAISVGPSHNYYFGRAESDISGWIEFFLQGMTYSFDKVIEKMTQSQTRGEEDSSERLRTLDPKQRKALELFASFEIITSRQIGELFGFKPRTSSALCKQWTEDGFLKIVDPSLKARKYALADKFKILIKK